MTEKLQNKMPHRSSSHGHHSHGHSGGSKKHALKASSMATRRDKSGGDSKKLLTKTYSEIGTVANNSQAETPTPSEKVSKWHRDILLVSPPTAATVIQDMSFQDDILKICLLVDFQDKSLQKTSKLLCFLKSGSSVMTVVEFHT